MDDLSKLAGIHHTDKGLSSHGYTPFYHKHLQHLRDTKFVLLEIGVGGYDKIDKGGGSLRMWADYFPNADIHGVDLFDKNIQGRFTIHKGSQDDKSFLEGLIQTIGTPTIIIDDASHINPLSIKTFDILFPWLMRGGYYICEDTHTSYWKENYDGNTDVFNLKSGTYINHILSLAHGMSNDIHGLGLQDNVKEINVYKNTIIVEKK